MRRVGSELDGALGSDQSLDVLKCGGLHFVVTKVVQVGGGTDEKGVVCLFVVVVVVTFFFSFPFLSFFFCSARYLSGGTG